jgi:cold shock CspA family protein
MSESWSKKEREKRKQKERQDKAEKMQQRREKAKEGKNPDSMIADVDENGNFSSTPPDPRKKIKIILEDIAISVPRQEDLPQEELIRNGKVTFFNVSKGFGFIKDNLSQQSIFVHTNNLSDAIQENDKVSFEVEMSHRGPMAVNVKVIA